MKELLHNALKDSDSRSVKVFLFPRKLNEQQKPVADGRVQFNNKYLFSNKESFRKWIIESMDEPFGLLSYTDFVEPKGKKWTENLDDVYMLMGALEILGFGRVVGNTIQEEILKGQGFNLFPMFKFRE